MRTRQVSLFGLFVVAGLATSLYAQQAAQPSADPARQGQFVSSGSLAHRSARSSRARMLAPKDYGTGVTYIEIPASQFQPVNSSFPFALTGYGWDSSGGPVGLYQTAGPYQPFAAAITSVLPAGALLTYFELDSCDTNASGDNVFAWLTVCDFQGVSCNTYQLTNSNNGDGCSYYGFDISGDGLVVDHDNYSYAVFADTHAFDGTNLISGIEIGYELKVNNYAGAPDFGDVPASNPQYQFIEALYHAGITAGCGGGNYCPNNTLTRGQMAVYLAKALGLYFQY